MPQQTEKFAKNVSYKVQIDKTESSSYLTYVIIQHPKSRKLFYKAMTNH